MFLRERTFVCFVLVIPVLLPCSPGDSTRYIYHDEFATNQDMTTRRENTLYDDADDLQPQLDNEFKEKLVHLKTTWMWSTPVHFPFAILPSTTPSILIVKLQQRNTMSAHKSNLVKRYITWKSNPQFQMSRTMYHGLFEDPKSESALRRTGIPHTGFYRKFQDVTKQNQEDDSGKNLYDQPLGGDHQRDKLSGYHYNDPSSEYQDGEPNVDYLDAYQYGKNPDEWPRYHSQHHDFSGKHQDNEEINENKDYKPNYENQNDYPIGENQYDGPNTVNQYGRPSSVNHYEHPKGKIHFDYTSGEYLDDKPYSISNHHKISGDYQDDKPYSINSHHKISGDYQDDKPYSINRHHKISGDYQDDKPYSINSHHKISGDYQDDKPYSINSHHKISGDYQDDKPYIIKIDQKPSAEHHYDDEDDMPSGENKKYHQNVKNKYDDSMSTDQGEDLNDKERNMYSQDENQDYNTNSVNNIVEHPLFKNLYNESSGKYQNNKGSGEEQNNKPSDTTNNSEYKSVYIESNDAKPEPSIDNMQPVTGLDNGTDIEPKPRTNKTISPENATLANNPTTGTSETESSAPTNETLLRWDFSNQLQWHEDYKDCKGTRQSPIDLSPALLRHGRGFQNLAFVHYRSLPTKLTYTNDGKRVFIQGSWDKTKWPLVYGGALFSRKYLFHSMSFYWPSEHTIEGLNFPMECQLLHIAAEYSSYADALTASAFDPNAFLGIVNIFKFENTQAVRGVQAIVDLITKDNSIGDHTMTPIPLADFSPPFLEYVCYHGSLTIPPCTEAVFWIINRRSLPLRREEASAMLKVARLSDPPTNIFVRMTQPVNDRKMYIFYEKPGPIKLSF